jgi:hypothetical protein
VLLIPVIAIAQAISYGWGSMFNMAYMSVQSAMGSYGMPGAMHGMGDMMGWGWKAVSAFIIICGAHVHWFVLQLKLISIQSIIVLMMR